MVILKVGLLRKPPVLCTSGKIYQLSFFHFKFSHYIYTPLYIQEKQVELHPRVSESHCNSDLVFRLCTSSLALNITLLDFALPHSLSLSHAFTSLSHALAHSCISHFAPLIAIGIAHRAHYKKLISSQHSPVHTRKTSRTSSRISQNLVATQISSLVFVVRLLLSILCY
jgi:hypothetical protein